MNNQTKPIRASRKTKQEYWERHVRDWNESSLSQKQYCSDNHLKLATFRYWKSKVEPQSPTKPLLPVTIKPPTSSPTQFFPSGISISVTDHISIQLEVSFNRDTLLKVLELLESR